MVWMISLHERSVEAIKNGSKRIEVRTRLPKSLRPCDILLVVQTGTNGRVVLRLTVGMVLKYTPAVFWERYGHETALKKSEFMNYAAGHSHVFGLYVTDVKGTEYNIYCGDFEISRPPQWFLSVKHSSDLGIQTLWHRF